MSSDAPFERDRADEIGRRRAESVDCTNCATEGGEPATLRLADGQRLGVYLCRTCAGLVSKDAWITVEAGHGRESAE